MLLFIKCAAHLFTIMVLPYINFPYAGISSEVVPYGRTLTESYHLFLIVEIRVCATGFADCAYMGVHLVHPGVCTILRKLLLIR